MPTDLEGLRQEIEASARGSWGTWLPEKAWPLFTQWVTEHDAELTAVRDKAIDGIIKLTRERDALRAQLEAADLFTMQIKAACAPNWLRPEQAREAIRNLIASYEAGEQT